MNLASLPRVCAGCGCLCDDILEVEIPGRSTPDFEVRGKPLDCAPGREWLSTHSGAAIEDIEVVDAEGQPLELEAGLEEAARLLDCARAPGVIGGAGLDHHGQRVLADLAAHLGAPIFPGTVSPTLAPGLFTPSLGVAWDVVREEADLVIFWGADVTMSHPRFLERVLGGSSTLEARTVIIATPEADDDLRKRVRRSLAIDGAPPTEVHTGACGADAASRLAWLLRIRAALEDASQAELLPDSLAGDIVRGLERARRVQVFLGPVSSLEEEAWRLAGAHRWERQDFGVNSLPGPGNPTGLGEVLTALLGTRAPLEFSIAGPPRALEDTVDPLDLGLDLALVAPGSELDLPAGLPTIGLGPTVIPGARIHFRTWPLARVHAAVTRGDGRTLRMRPDLDSCELLGRPPGDERIRPADRPDTLSLLRRLLTAPGPGDLT